MKSNGIKWPGIKILDRYIIGKFLGTYVMALLFIIVVVVVFDIAEKMDDFIELKAPAKEIAFGYYLNFIPFFVNQFSGLITFIVLIFFTSRMAYNTEIVAMLSGGVSFKRFLWPYFLASCVITAFSITLNLFVIPQANERRIEFETHFLKKGRRVKFEEHIYRQIEPGTFAYIRDYRSGDKSASFLVLETYDGSAIQNSLEASQVKFNAETKRWSAPRYITKKYVDGKEYMEKHEKLDTMINLTSDELGKVDNLVKTMGFKRLNSFIQQQRNKGSDMVRQFEVERYTRVAYPMSTFVLTLIGVAISSRKVRGGTGLHIGMGLGLCFSYILFIRFAEEFAKGGVMTPLLAVWFPNIIYAVVAIYLYKKAPK
ncbi:MAG: LptF/LptG family permease [Rikenellaceae bacterium]|jgi:lipopolysaccharide export system permease protein|nr:LptF/LptG family permease [Rikenellaceae bacterium]